MLFRGKKVPRAKVFLKYDFNFSPVKVRACGPTVVTLFISRQRQAGLIENIHVRFCHLNKGFNFILSRLQLLSTFFKSFPVGHDTVNSIPYTSSTTKKINWGYIQRGSRISYQQHIHFS